MTKNLLLFFAIITIAFSATAQEKHATCGADDYHQHLYDGNAQYRASYDETKAYLSKLKINNYKTVTTTSGTEYHVPVVVHVLHTGLAVGTNYNPSVATINALIAQINNGFANTFNDPATAGTFNSVNIPIRFYLAQRDENGCVATTGINRVNMSGNATYVASGVSRGGPGVTDAVVKAQGSWNDLNYYNIYIVNKINGEDGYTTTGSYTAGYASYPVLGGNSSDGMVCLAFSAAQATSTTFIHEMGHGFNLAHTFEGGNTTTCPSNTNCNTDNDEVCDTEPMRNSFTCNPTGNNPCTGAAWAGGQWNYMAYNGCTDRFTAGQSTRVMSALNDVRTGYKNSAGIDAPPASLPTAITAPPYTAANANNNFNMGPRRVQFNAIDFTSNGYSFEGTGYVHYRNNTCNQATTVLAGNTYALTVNTQGNNQDCRVYIDYNNDGTFNPTAERVLNSNGSGAPQAHTANVVIPNTAVFNTPLRMRVIADFASATISPTGTLLYGQAEDYTVTIIGAPLPVIWRSVSATLNSEKNIDVRWSTEMEDNSEVFEIEKSKNGTDFYKIGSLTAAGTTNLPSYYNFEDKTNVNGYNYYRIKNIDIDGKASYSKTVSVIISSEETDIVIFPNPTTSELHININGLSESVNNVHYIVTDLNGTVIEDHSEKTTDDNLKMLVNLRDNPKGMYFVQLNINGISSSHKIVKQ